LATAEGCANFDYCEVCNVILTSQVTADQHYKGQKHKAKIAEARRVGKL